jgi:hypothetical protein
VPTAELTLPSLRAQAERLIALGVHDTANLSADQLREVTIQPQSEAALLVVHPDVAPASAVAGALSVNGKPAFVVSDLSDVDEFTPIPSAELPDAPVYLVRALDRGDAMANWSPDEALPAIDGAGRTPLALTEGLHWVLQQPEVLQRRHCFMTIGSRRRKKDGSLDSRVPAVWISNGTGRDGPGNRDAPKVGWCWAGNRHTWLGFASAAERLTLDGFAV